jgi:predicted transcriptional regulator
MKTQPITYRLPADLYERLRATAYARHISMNAIVTKAVEAELDAMDADR